MKCFEELGVYHAERKSEHVAREDHAHIGVVRRAAAFHDGGRQGMRRLEGDRRAGGPSFKVLRDLGQPPGHYRDGVVWRRSEAGDLDTTLAPLDPDVVDGSLVVRWISAHGRISVGARWASVATGYATWRSRPLPDDLPIKRRRRRMQ
jgi:hypothetical protein